MTDASRDGAETGQGDAAPREFIPEDKPSELGPPPRTPAPSGEQPTTLAPEFSPAATSEPAPSPARGFTPSPAHATSGATVPDVDGLDFMSRRKELNSRAIIGMVLSGLALLGVLVWFVGFATPLLVTVGLAIGGIVMGALGRSAARRGLATNKGLALAAIITGSVAILATVAVYVLLLIALSSWV